MILYVTGRGGVKISKIPDIICVWSLGELQNLFKSFGIGGVLVLRREVEAAAAEVHRGLHAGAEGNLHRKGARPNHEACPVVPVTHRDTFIARGAVVLFLVDFVIAVDHSHMTFAVGGGEGTQKVGKKKGGWVIQ